MEKSMRLAKVLLGIGVMMTSVPLGVMIVSLLVEGGEDGTRIGRLGWAIWVAFGMLPLGVAFVVVGMGWLVKLKKRAKLEEEADED